MQAGECAVVTGGNRGIGLEACRQLARRGLRVILTGRDLARAQAAAASLGASGSGPVEAWALDVGDAASVAAFAARLEAERAPVHALINNAGVSLHGFDADRVAATLNVNYFGAVRVTEALLPLVPRGGRIVMVSSGMGELSGFAAPLRALPRPGARSCRSRRARRVLHRRCPSPAARAPRLAEQRLPRLEGRAQHVRSPSRAGARRPRDCRQRRLPWVGPHRHGRLGRPASRRGGRRGRRVGRHAPRRRTDRRLPSRRPRDPVVTRRALARQKAQPTLAVCRRGRVGAAPS